MGRISKEQIQERERLAESGLKRCSIKSGCGEIKPIDEFGAHKHQWDKKSTVCLICTRKKGNQYAKDSLEAKRASARQSYLNNREARREYYAKRNQADPMFYRLKSGKDRAKKAGTEWQDISFTSLLSHWQLNNISVDTCHYCKQTIDKEELQIDHGMPISRGGGHTLDNLFPSHSRCNLDKKDKTAEEYLEHLRS